MPDLNPIYQVLPEIIEWSQRHTQAGPVHGLHHWNRVAQFGLQLCEAAEQANRRVVLLFAYLHDSCRQDDWRDPQHGPRAAKAITELRNTLLACLTDEEFRTLQAACRMHTALEVHHTAARNDDHEHATSAGSYNDYEWPWQDLTIYTCCDADRLDLGRVGITPDPRRMLTPAGAAAAKNAAK